MEHIMFRGRVHRANVTQADPDDVGSVIIAAHGNSSEEARTLEPRVVLVDTKNRGLNL
ncbi:hypothetical protein DAETH_07850 [Deinococcus aetherius]|uniref:Aspartate 1-decarboxylase n=2 Tax=Deinococcus aetherius TaxID=200252 RepID=A0ABM8AB22_9DEIO|nr:hypothetical protein DAETH_07850 [Deinococcus aetherius]